MRRFEVQGTTAITPGVGFVPESHTRIVRSCREVAGGRRRIVMRGPHSSVSVSGREEVGIRISKVVTLRRTSVSRVSDVAGVGFAAVSVIDLEMVSR